MGESHKILIFLPFFYREGNVFSLFTTGGGVPQSQMGDRGTACKDWGTNNQDWGTPWPGLGYPWDPDWGTPPRQVVLWAVCLVRSPARLFTTCIRRMGEGNVLTHVCPSTILSVHGGGVRSSWGGEVQLGGVRSSQGGVRSSWGGQPPGGVSHWGGQPPGGSATGGISHQGGSATGGVSHQEGQPLGGSATGGDQPLGGSATVGVSHRGGSAKTGQHREYLLHGGRYASCGHAGGLSCLFCF